MSDKNDTVRNPQINIQSLCQKHESLLVHGAKYLQKDPWRVLLIAAQIALFQAAAADERTHKKIGDDVSKIGTLGCLACYKPDAFGEIVETAKSHDIKKVKALGERWCGMKVGPPQDNDESGGS